MLIAGILLMAISAGLGIRSMLVLARVNPGAPMPMWGNPPNSPWSAILLRCIGGGLVFWGWALAAPSIGFWALLLVVVASGLPLAFFVVHNRRVAALRVAERP